MKYGEIPGARIRVSRLIQGIGRARSLGDEHGFAMLDTYLELGCNTVDTARIYGDVDAFLGRWMISRGNRDRVIVLAKGAHHGDGRQRVTPDDIRQDLDTTLREMQTDYVDLYILHRDDRSVPVGPIVEVLNEARRAGKIDAFGGSNWTSSRLEAANQYAADHGLVPFACSNPNYSLAEQIEEPWDNCISISGPGGEAEREWYRRTQFPALTWSSLAGGFWSGRLTPENRDEIAPKMQLVARCYYSEPNFERLRRVTQLAADKGTSVAQIALAWIFHQGLNLFALVGSQNREELQANIDAMDMHLTQAECAYVDLQTDGVPE